VDDGQIQNMVVSIGWNPFYGNTKKSFETHIINKFEKDFYGSELGVVVCGFLREEKNYDSLEALKGKLTMKLSLRKCSLLSNVPTSFCFKRTRQYIYKRVFLCESSANFINISILLA
jgi:hypothetical protein